MKAGNKKIKALVYATLTAALSLGGHALAQPTASIDAKVVRSTAGAASDRGGAPMRDRSMLVESETRSVERLARNAKGDARTAAATLEEAWIYDADVELFDDLDGDGFFTYLRVSFDADSIYSEHWVYARLFLTQDGVNWDEYHITDDFLIEGSTAFDDYEVETELVAGFPPDYYDALIELYDADFGYFLGEFGPAQSSAFSLLPLEDIDADFVEPVIVISSEGGGGALDWTTVFGLSLLAGASLAARRRYALKAETAAPRLSDRNASVSRAR